MTAEKKKITISKKNKSLSHFLHQILQKIKQKQYEVVILNVSTPKHFTKTQELGSLLDSSKHFGNTQVTD